MNNNPGKLYEMIDDIETAMMTTRCPDGSLVSRPMATQKRAEGADLWFVTIQDAGKIHEIEQDPHVNLAYYKDRTREWISISGLAHVSRDREKIRELYSSDWKAWFPDDGARDGGTPDDPRIALIGVEIRTAYYMQLDKPTPVLLFEALKGRVTGERVDVPEVQKIRK